MRTSSIIPDLSRLKIDGFFTLTIVVLIIVLRPYIIRMRFLLAFFGKHSANIYLTHTFLNAYWPTAIWLHNNLSGFVKFVVLFTTSLLLSICIECFKEKFKYNKMIDRLLSLIEY